MHIIEKETDSLSESGSGHDELDFLISILVFTVVTGYLFYVSLHNTTENATVVIEREREREGEGKGRISL